MQEVLQFLLSVAILYGLYVYFKNRKTKKEKKKEEKKAKKREREEKKKEEKKKEEKKKEEKKSYDDLLKEQGFVISKTVSAGDLILSVDDEHKKWAVCQVAPFKPLSVTIYDYSNLIDYEVFEDGDSIASGRAGSALVGGVLFGGVGAVVGGSRKKKIKKVCTGLEVRIRVNNLQEPEKVATLINSGSKVKKDSNRYKTDKAKANELVSVLTYIQHGCAAAE